MAAAVQHAPEKTPKGYRTPEEKTRQQNGGNALHNIPRAAGIAIMAVLLVISLFAGNFRALQRATPKAFLRQGDVASIVEDRMDAARNAKSVALRAAVDEMLIDGVEDALYAMEEAETAYEISRADQDLTAAVSEMVASAMEKLDSENRTMLMSAADDFAEQGSFLRQEARAFNEKAEEAEAVYEKLPTKFLYDEPDVYEGI